MKKWYVTTPIYYVNGPPHYGHAYTTILADIANRYYQMQGYDTFFLTGTDEHGDKIAKSAANQKITPKEYADNISNKFRELWPKLNINYNRFIRTTESSHIKIVQEILQRIYDKGEIYKTSYKGKYCVGCERFLSEDELDDEGACIIHGSVPEIIEEENYFFQMSKYQEWLIDYINKNASFIMPERYRNETLGMLREPIPDLCISRPKSRLTWGITLPFDSEYVTYVWFDALLNYVTGLDYPDGELFQKFWVDANHIIAKDILRPHAVYWPTMLKAAGIDLFQHLIVHGYWTRKGRKEGKTLIEKEGLSESADPLTLIEHFGPDAVRYVLTKEMIFGNDAEFGSSVFVESYNSDLANDLGNLGNRLQKLVETNNQGSMPKLGELNDDDRQLLQRRERLNDEILDNMRRFAIHQLAHLPMALVRELNVYINKYQPWNLVKTGDMDRFNTVINVSLNVYAHCLFSLYPIMPKKITGMLASLGITENDINIDKFKDLPLKEGQKISPPGTFFPRITKDLLKKILPKDEEQPSVEKDEKKDQQNSSEINFQDFEKLDLRIARITQAKKHPNADKLLLIQISLGDEERQVVAGIANSYKPEELIDKQILMLANLKPKKIRGELSHGMILAIDMPEGKVSLVSPLANVPDGAKAH